MKTQLLPLTDSYSHATVQHFNYSACMFSPDSSTQLNTHSMSTQQLLTMKDKALRLDIEEKRINMQL